MKDVHAKNLEKPRKGLPPSSKKKEKIKKVWRNFKVRDKHFYYML